MWLHLIGGEDNKPFGKYIWLVIGLLEIGTATIGGVKEHLCEW